MIGNNFILEPFSFERTFTLPEVEGTSKRLSESRNQERQGEELEKLGMQLESSLSGSTDLSQYSFYRINTQDLTDAEEAALSTTSSSEVAGLTLEPIDIRRDSTLVAQAINDRAIVAFKSGNGQKKATMKMDPKWESYVQRKKVKQIKVKRPDGNVEQVIDIKDIETKRLTEEEMNLIATKILKAIAIAQKAKQVEQEKRDHAAIIQGEKQLQEQCQRSKKSLDPVKEVVRSFIFTLASQLQSSFEAMIEKYLTARREELKREEELEERDEKQIRIVKKEIENFELKRDILQALIVNKFY